MKIIRLPSFREIRFTANTAAIILSCCALGVSGIQAYYARAQLKASVWPRLGLDVSASDNHIKITLHNKGVGPAIIQRFEITYRGKHYHFFSQLIRENLPPAATGKSVNTLCSSFNRGDVLAPSDESSLLEMTNDSSGAAKWLTPIVSNLSDTSDFAVKTWYTDIYGECWLMKNGAVFQADDCDD